MSVPKVERSWMAVSREECSAPECSSNPIGSHRGVRDHSARRAVRAMSTRFADLGMAALIACFLASGCPGSDASQYGITYVGPEAFVEHLERNLMASGPEWHFVRVNLSSRYTVGTSIHPLLADEHGRQDPEKLRMVSGFRRRHGRLVIPETIEQPPHEFSWLYPTMTLSLKLEMVDGELALLRWVLDTSPPVRCNMEVGVSPTITRDVGAGVRRWLDRFVLVTTSGELQWSGYVPQQDLDGTWVQTPLSAPSFPERPRDGRFVGFGLMRPGHSAALSMLEGDQVQSSPLHHTLTLRSSSESTSIRQTR